MDEVDLGNCSGNIGRIESLYVGVFIISIRCNLHGDIGFVCDFAVIILEKS